MFESSLQRDLWTDFGFALWTWTLALKLLRPVCPRRYYARSDPRHGQCNLRRAEPRPGEAPADPRMRQPDAGMDDLQHRPTIIVKSSTVKGAGSTGGESWTEKYAANKTMRLG
jgi:hypothetical protein